MKGIKKQMPLCAAVDSQSSSAAIQARRPSIRRHLAMSTKQRFKSDACESIHASAGALQNVSAIDKATMKDFDAIAFAELPIIKPASVKQLREKTESVNPYSRGI